jgi:hypothetical protein
VTSTYSHRLTFKCAVCFKNYETGWNPDEDVDISFLCECGTPLTVKTLRAEPNEPAAPITIDHK